MRWSLCVRFWHETERNGQGKIQLLRKVRYSGGRPKFEEKKWAISSAGIRVNKPIPWFDDEKRKQHTTVSRTARCVIWICVFFSSSSLLLLIFVVSTVRLCRSSMFFIIFVVSLLAPFINSQFTKRACNFFHCQKKLNETAIVNVECTQRIRLDFNTRSCMAVTVNLFFILAGTSMWFYWWFSSSV